MDYSIIDELYEIYLNEFIEDAEESFEQYYKRYQMNGAHDLEATLQQYIKEQTQNFSNSFVSNKDNENKVDLIVRETAAAFESMLSPVQFLLDDYVYQDCEIEDLKFDGIKHDIIKPHDLFNIDLKFIDEAMKKYENSYEEAYERVKAIIQYVKQNKLLEELYADGSWHEINFEELIANLYDKSKNKEIFEVDFIGVLMNAETLFDRIKENCGRVSSVDFDKYRPQLNSSKQIRAEFGKLIFCKNLLTFYQTGIMPNTDGMVDLTTTELEEIFMLDEFKELYSKNFDETNFRENQINIICNPFLFGEKYKVQIAKKASIGNRMIMGYIIEANDSYGTAFKYLIHINIADVNNPCSNYEIQLNVLPHGRISNRLQLMRLDNWESEQPHKNIAKKIATTTHIHLYNEFDLLRGKINGNYDIAYNLEGKSTNFETSLKTFLEILDFDDVTQRKMLNTTIKCINNCITIEKTAEI